MKNLSSILLIFLALTLYNCNKGDANPNKNANGKAGSTAKMITVGHYLYVINKSELMVYDVQNSLEPNYVNTVDIGFGIETIFPFGDNLFIGSSTGLYIYNITDPTAPVLATEEPVDHFTACDPVVANNNYAYVTLNSLRTDCGNTTNVNLLLTYDISDIENTTEISSQEMTGPKGLAISDTRLFVCDETEGIVIFDITETPEHPESIGTISGFTANDIIIDNTLMMVVCEDGLRQYDITDNNNITLLSYINTHE